MTHCHIVSYILYLCCLKFIFMERLLTNKIIDEKRQGELLDFQKKTSNKKMYIESYGCQMNFSDSEIVASIMHDSGYSTTKNIADADIAFINTCSIREKAEDTARKRISFYNSVKKKENPNLIIGVLGCMAERLKTKFLDDEKIVDLVIGPDAYRDLPNLIKDVNDGRKAINVILSLEETYADISPVRTGTNGITAFVTITRGCDNMCSFCVVPYTRGRERSRDPQSIINECRKLIQDGYKEVTLLGQNVDSYLWYGGGPKKHFKKLSKNQQNESTNFAKLLEIVAINFPELRIRFSTSNPQDMTEEVITTMKNHKNICKYIHLPVQSGSSKILKLMNRGYDRPHYLKLIDMIKKHIPECGISMDMISGFCTETEKDHLETLTLMDYVKFDYGYMFNYSERSNTPASRMEDDVPNDIKKRRLSEIINKQMKHSLFRNKEKIGKTYNVLIEGISKKSSKHFFGRTTQNTVVVFPKGNHEIGEYIQVKINDCTSATLLGNKIS